MTHTVTAKTIIAYGAGLLAFLNALGAMLMFSPAVLLFLVALVVSFPPMRWRAEYLLDFELSTAAAVMLYIVFTLGGNAWLIAKGLV